MNYIETMCYRFITKLKITCGCCGRGSLAAKPRRYAVKIMKAIKVTTAEGKSITDGIEDAYKISVEYQIFPKKDLIQYHVYAILFGSKSKEIY